MIDSLVINEIYLSLQGESSFAGLPCVFVRLTGCDLRCSWCDTAYAFSEGKKQSRAEVRNEVHRLARAFVRRQSVRKRGEKGVNSTLFIPPPGPWLPSVPMVELTGGEPLLQKGSLLLMKELCDDGYTVLLETSGAHDIASVDRRVHRIVDLKCPSSGESNHNRWENIGCLGLQDELKFVIATREDYEWAKATIAQYRLDSVCSLLFSWVQPLAPAQRVPSLKTPPTGHTPISRQELAEKILADALPVRFQVQLHKIIWAPDQRGV